MHGKQKIRSGYRNCDNYKYLGGRNDKDGCDDEKIGQR